jgi:hypothetical protein
MDAETLRTFAGKAVKEACANKQQEILLAVPLAKLPALAGASGDRRSPGRRLSGQSPV